MVDMVDTADIVTQYCRCKKMILFMNILVKHICVYMCVSDRRLLMFYDVVNEHQLQYYYEKLHCDEFIRNLAPDSISYMFIQVV